MNIDYFWHHTLRRPYKLHTAHKGSAHKQTIVFLHGIAASGDDWRPCIDILSRYYHCITIDLLGFGKSPKPTWCDYSMQDHMRSIHHTLNSLKLDKHYSLVGHSLGSLLASRYAREHERHIKRLVLMSPPVYPPLTSIQNARARRKTNLLLKTYRFLHTNPHVNPQSLFRLGKILPLPRFLLARLQEPGIWLAFKRTLERCIEQQNIIEDIQMIHIPVHAYHGAADKVVLGENVALLAQNPHVTVHSFSGNHDITPHYAQLVASTAFGLKRFWR